MRTSFFRVLVLGLGLAVAAPALAQAPAPLAKPIRIGVMNDRSGPYASLSGNGSAVAARLAAEEFGQQIDGFPIEIVVADHLNKPDVGSGIARRWFDSEGVDVIADIANSGVGLAVMSLAKDRNKIVLITGSSNDITGRFCTPATVQWGANAYALAKGVTSALMKQKLDSWFTIAVDYAYGHSLVGSLKYFIESGGGKLVGEVYHPIDTADFSAVLLQAQTSRAKVVALASSGHDLTNLIKGANEFGIANHQVLVSASEIFLPEIESLGLETVHGLLAPSSFEWTRTAESRAWTHRFVERAGQFPSSVQAGVYSEVRHYLAAVAATHTLDTATIIARMRALPVHDAYTDNGRLREDGQLIHDLYLVRAKEPSESHEKGDDVTILETLKGDEIFRPLSETDCPYVGNNK